MPLYRTSGVPQERLLEHERRLHFPGEIHKFWYPTIPAIVLFARVKTSFMSSTGGTHCDEIQPINPSGWKNFDDAVEKVAAKALAMRSKNLIHCLPYGGSKGAIVGTQKLAGKTRIRLFSELWPHAINTFWGELHTGADVGVGTNEVMIARARTPFVFGLPESFGGSGDPSENTAYGLMGVIEKYFESGSAVRHRGDTPTVAVKGVGKVGRALVEKLRSRGYAVIVADTNPDAMRAIQSQHPGVEICDPQTIHTRPADVFAPCDASVTVTEETVDQFQCKAIIGAANDQCRDPKLEDRLHVKGILHMTDYLVNGGGVITITSELDPKGYDPTAVRAKIDESVIAQSARVMEESRKTGVPPYQTCQRIVDEEAHRTGNVV